MVLGIALCGQIAMADIIIVGSSFNPTYLGYTATCPADRVISGVINADKVVYFDSRTVTTGGGTNGDGAMVYGGRVSLFCAKVCN